MGSLKTLALAGAVATVATSAALSTSAIAADLMPPPMVAPAPPPMVDGISGLYLRGDIGVAKAGHDKFYQNEVNTVAPGGEWLRSSIGDAAMMGVGIGYQVNNFLRFDLTGEYRTAAALNAIDQYNYTCGFTAGSCTSGQTIKRNNIWSGNMSSVVALANAYADLGTWNGLTPFVGVGIGGAYNKIYGVRDFDPSDLGGAGYANDKSKWNMAWALHAGLAYDVSPNFKVELAYRYLNLGDVESGKLNCFTAAGTGCNGAGGTYGPLKVKNVDSSDFKIGVRWLLADRAVPMAMPAGPLVRKY